MVLLPMPAAAQAPGGAQPQARLDRDRIGFDESFTLIVEMDGERVGERFDIAPLRDRSDFTLLKYDNRQDVRLVGGRNRTHIVYTFELAPQRTGRLTVPPLRVGAHWTRPLTVTVLPPGDRSPPPLPPPGSEAFIEALIEERTPYVQQSVGYTLRLYYDGGSMIDGTLNQDAPQNADLFKVGEDLHYHRQLGEQVFKVLERRYSLVPARPGAVVLPAARFEGRSARSMFDDMLRGGRRQLRVFGPRYVLQARPVPAQAPQPWLPLRGVRMQWLEAPQELRAGEAATVTLRVIADGAGAGQLAEPELQVTGGDAQVFPDVVRSEERFIDGHLQTTLTRSFSVVPVAEGDRLTLHAPQQAWWDVAVGRARSSSLPDLQRTVVAGRQVAALGAGAAVAQPEEPTPLERRWNRLREWYAEDPALRLAWTALLCTWLGVMLLLAWSRQRALRRKPMPAHPDVPAAMVYDAAALRRLFAAGDLAEITRTLCAMATPPAPDLDRLRMRLADPAQREAVVLLQRARWGTGDVAAVRHALRDAFADGPKWRPAPARTAAAPLLPPLYPA